MERIWRCSVCKKVKELQGKHLDGKTSVRSDCWPCAKKQTFVTDTAAAATPADPSVFRSQSATAPAATTDTANTVFGCSSSVAPPFGGVAHFLPTCAATTSVKNSGLAAPPPTNPFLTGSSGPMAAAAAKNSCPKSARGASSSAGVLNASLGEFTSVVAAQSGANTSSGLFASEAPPNSSVVHPLSKCGTTPIIMEVTKKGYSPSFTFKVAPVVSVSDITIPTSVVGANTALGPGAAAAASPEHATAAPSNDPTWVCAVCHKVKALRGPHLSGKTAVRSDCWPCATKRLFVLVKNCAEPTGRAVVAGSATATTAPAASPWGGVFASPETSAAATPPAVTDASASPWCNPVIPPNEAVTVFYLLPGGADEVLQDDEAAGGKQEERLRLAAAARFDAQLLRGYRLRLVEGIPTRCVWSRRVLYVIAEEPPTAVLSTLGAVPTVPRTDDDVAAYYRAYAMMGRYAALLLAVEQKLAGGPYRRLRRLFCGSEFAFAACCCYAMHCAREGGCLEATAASSPMVRAQRARDGSSVAPVSGGCGFTCYGPRADPTRAPTLWGNIIAQCDSSLAESCVVSGEQRILAAQTLYRRTSWLAEPVVLTGAAIQLEEEMQRQHQRGQHEDVAALAAEDDGVEVVLFPGTMKLEDLPSASALALHAKPF